MLHSILVNVGTDFIFSTVAKLWTALENLTASPVIINSAVMRLINHDQYLINLFLI